MKNHFRILFLSSITFFASHANATDIPCNSKDNCEKNSITTNNKKVRSEKDIRIQAENNIKLVHYWAYYGKYSTNSQDLGDTLSRISDLTAKIYNISRVDAYNAFATDIRAQGGPKFLLASTVPQRLLQGLSLGFAAEVSAVINSAYSLNREYGASMAAMSMEFLGKNLSRDTANAIKPPNFSHVDQCFRSCGIYYLGLQGNRFFNDLSLNRAKNLNNYTDSEQQQVYSRFPNKENAAGRASLRQEVDSRVASTSASRECISSCVNDIWLSTVGGFGSGFLFGYRFGGVMPGAALGTAAGIGAGALKTLECTGSAKCGKSREQELQEQERDRLKVENDLREERNRKEALDAQDREKKNNKDLENHNKKEQTKTQEDEKIQRKIEETARKEAKQEEERKKKIEEDIKNSFDRDKNEEITEDSSVDCLQTKTCEDTTTALTVPDQYMEPVGDGQLRDSSGNILTKEDLITTPALTTEPQASNNDKKDGTGKIITKLDMTGIPTVVIDDNKSDSKRDGNGNIVTELDMLGTPGMVNLIDFKQNPSIPIKDMGINVKNSTSN